MSQLWNTHMHTHTHLYMQLYSCSIDILLCMIHIHNIQSKSSEIIWEMSMLTPYHQQNPTPNAASKGTTGWGLAPDLPLFSVLQAGWKCRDFQLGIWTSFIYSIEQWNFETCRHTHTRARIRTERERKREREIYIYNLIHMCNRVYENKKTHIYILYIYVYHFPCDHTPKFRTYKIYR